MNESILAQLVAVKQHLSNYVLEGDRQYSLDSIFAALDAIIDIIQGEK